MKIAGVVLAAGRGSRLDPVTADRPKALIEVAGRTLLSRQLEALDVAGAELVAVVTGWCANRVEATGVTTIHNPDWSTGSMVESLLCAAPLLDNADLTVVVYGDIVLPGRDLKRLTYAHGGVRIAYDPLWASMWSARSDDPLADAETFRIDGADRVLEIGARPTRTDEVEGQYVGALAVTRTAWRALADLAVDGVRDMTDLLSTAIARRPGSVVGVAIDGPWWEFDTADDLRIGEAVVRTIDSEGDETNAD